MRAPIRAVMTLARFSRLARVAPFVLALVPAIAACATYQDELARSQRAFEHADYERALAIFRTLEPDVPSHFSRQEQAQYAYLRGMTDYRVGYKVDARHWLALAHAIDETGVGVLPQDWKGRMKETLGELNEQVYAAGIENLAESQEEAAKAAPASSTKPKSEDEP
jgi:hypothetical protein